jgi:hypothetical protein
MEKLISSNFGGKLPPTKKPIGGLIMGVQNLPCN